MMQIDGVPAVAPAEGAQRAALARGYTLLIAFVETAHPDRALVQRLVLERATTMIVLQGVGLVLALLASRWIFARLRPGFADMV